MSLNILAQVAVFSDVNSDGMTCQEGLNKFRTENSQHDTHNEDGREHTRKYHPWPWRLGTVKKRHAAAKVIPTAEHQQQAPDVIGLADFIERNQLYSYRSFAWY